MSETVSSVDPQLAQDQVAITIALRAAYGEAVSTYTAARIAYAEGICPADDLVGAAEACCLLSALLNYSPELANTWLTETHGVIRNTWHSNPLPLERLNDIGTAAYDIYKENGTPDAEQFLSKWIGGFSLELAQLEPQ